MEAVLNVLCIGDIVGSPGRQMIRDHVAKLRKHHDIHFTIANAENAAGGFGVTPIIYDELMRAGVDVCTSGNHIYGKREILDQFDRMPRLIRPLNFPGPHPGKGVVYHQVGPTLVAVVNVIGRVFMGLSDCPFQALDTILVEVRKKTPVIIVDIHAEATSEKQAFAWNFAGQVSAVFGTHTHVATADPSILEGATAYVTDLGMTGAKRSVLGMEIATSIKKLRTQLPAAFSPSKSVEKMLNAVK
ncbi:YmdB family metallophosphoesterase, partial [bacterium]|nr:YmdB family metallophosphoesterase [bacterium]